MLLTIKNILTSKTFWFNAAATLAWLSNQDWIKANPGLVQAVGASIALTNIVLRLVTNSAVRLPWQK